MAGTAFLHHLNYTILNSATHCEKRIKKQKYLNNREKEEIPFVLFFKFFMELELFCAGVSSCGQKLGLLRMSLCGAYKCFNFAPKTTSFGFAIPFSLTSKRKPTKGQGADDSP